MARGIGPSEYFADSVGQRITALEVGVRALKDSVDAALLSAKEAVLKAEAATTLRFESVNEFRQTLTDQTSTFVPRTEIDVRLGTMQKDIDILAKQQVSGAGRWQGVSAGWSILVTLISMAIAVISVVAALSR